jgi:hypothetical protein
MIRARRDIFSSSWKPRRSAFSRFFEELFFRSWWVVSFFLMCHLLYETTSSHWKEEFSSLENQLLLLQKEKQYAIEEKEEMLRQIKSHNDHDWIEIILKKELGLVPEGQKKVFFKGG